ncbi:MAG: GAF domain-containing protein [Armatimonadota bacterium]|nr:GAF domain-containing protein [Armatimonadota bacterium]
MPQPSHVQKHPVRDRAQPSRIARYRSAEKKALLKLGTSLLGSLDPHEIATLTAHTVAEFMEVPLVEVRLADEEGRWLVLQGAVGVPEDETRIDRVQIGDLANLAGWAASQEGPVTVADLQKDSRFSNSPLARLGMRSALACSFTNGFQILGTIAAASRRRRRFEPNEVHFLSLVANQVALALERTRLFITTQNQLHELAILAEAATSLRAAHTVEEMYTVLLNHAVKVGRADAGLLCMVDRELGEIVPCAVHKLPHAILGKREAIGDGLVSWVIQNNAPASSEDLEKDPRIGLGEAVQGLHAGLLLPLRTTAGEVVGTLLLGRRRKDPFDVPEERILQAVAEMGANALQRAELFEELEQAYLQAVVALSKAIDARDSATSHHSNRIAILGAAVAEAMGCSREEIETILWAATLHDIGKISIPDAILHKTGPLTEDEWALIRRHPAIGSEIVAPLRRLHKVLPMIRYHQERWDGTGYPEGLKGEEIPLGARILSVVDAYVAMTEDRPYRKARTHEQAMEEIRHQARKQFDPRVVEVFCEVMEKMKERTG